MHWCSCKADGEQRAMLSLWGGRAMHKGRAKRTESSVQCTRGGVQSEMGAACNALWACNGKWEQCAMHWWVCKAKWEQCATDKMRAKESGAACNAQEGMCKEKWEQCAMHRWVCKALWERCAMHKRGCAKQNGSSVQCTRGMQSERKAACNAQEGMC